MTPERLMLISFAGLIAFGTLGLMWLPGLYVDESLSWLDALFTATSAVCVTGLIVVDTATHFSRAGQAFVLLLLQLGGLGILTLTTLIIVSLGRRLSLHHEAVATAGVADGSIDIDFRHLVRKVAVFALVFESVGAGILFLGFLPRFAVGEAAWHAVFQAVSAFCNAGFSTFSESLVGFRSSPLVLGPIMALIVLGGLGFLTLEELHRRSTRDRSPAVLSLHSRLVLAATATLVLAGWLAFTALEWGYAFRSMSTLDKIVNGLFMSVTARTAGFNTVDYSMVGEGSSFLTIILMSIGGSPGSTAGGLKTTTAAILVLLASARLRGNHVTSVGHRSIPDGTVRRAVELFVVGFLLVTLAIAAYVVIQLPPVGDTAHGFLTYVFEAVSAFNTVGLSMGATGDLTPSAKLLTVFLMFVGRVGTLTFASALVVPEKGGAHDFRYAREDVVLG